MLGFFLPTSTYACETKTQNSCCKGENSSKTEKKNCCKEKDSKDKENNSCAGKCGHSKCGCPSSSNGFTLVYEIYFKNNIFDFSTEKQKDFYSETIISSGFYSLWLIPKIS